MALTFREASSHEGEGMGVMREKYGPAWGRDIAEPMITRYLGNGTFRSIRGAWWASNFPTAKTLEENGIDCIIAVSALRGTIFLGVQISTAALGSEVWSKKMKQWQGYMRGGKDYHMQDEARRIGVSPGEPLPVAFVRFSDADVQTAWEKIPDRPPWQDPRAPQLAADASGFLPQSAPFKKRILENLSNSLDVLLQHRATTASAPSYRNLSAIREAFRVEIKALQGQETHRA